MPLPSISIVTPSLNQAAFLEENIKSVLEQNYSNLEHIVVDGGSTDGTLEILGKYSHLSWTSEPDQGQAHALNKGFKMTKGEVIGWLNSDDSYCPGIFHVVAEKFDDPNAMVVYGDAFEIDEQANSKRAVMSQRLTSESLIKYWKWKLMYLQPALFFRRKVFNAVGYLDENLHYAIDHDFFIRLLQQYTPYYIPIPLANSRLHGASKTGRVSRRVIPDYIWETHKVSRRYWGRATELIFYEYLFSFLGAIGLSVLKNLFLVKGSKSRGAVKRLVRSGLSQRDPFTK